MSMTIESLLLRTRRNFYQDGLAELFAGGILIIAGLSILVATHPLGTGIIFITGIWLVRLAHTKLRERISYPRSGYVLYRHESSRGQLIDIIYGVILIFVIFGTLGLLVVLFNDAALPWLTFLVGLAIGLILLIQSLAIKLYRLTILGLLSILISLAISLLIPSTVLIEGYMILAMLGIYFLIFGLAMFTWGGLVSRDYLRKHIPEQVPQ